MDQRKLACDAKAAQLAPALLLLLQRRKLNRWAVGVLVNSLWLLALLSALAILPTLLATRRYGFVGNHHPACGHLAP